MGQAPGSAGRKSDLRKSLRFQVDDAVPLVYRKTLLTALGISRRNEARAAVNLSEGGILVRTDDRVQSGTRVKVRLEIGKFKDVIGAEGVVRWCFKGAGEDAGYFAGIHFTRVSKADADTIVRLRGYFTSPEYRSRTAGRRRREAEAFQFTE